MSETVQIGPVSQNLSLSATQFSALVAQAHSAYAARIAEEGVAPWWTAVVITAGSAGQAERYREELKWRQEAGRLPSGAVYLVVSDPEDQRIGSGGATIHSVRVLVEKLVPDRLEGSLEEWWARQRVLMIHSGGDSRRLPQYSLSGKLFSAVPMKAPWGGTSTVFDEMLALSTSWIDHIPSGLLVCSGDVILVFDPQRMDMGRPGVSGVAIRQPAAIGTMHGVYLADEQGRVRSFLQKPSTAQLKAAGGTVDGSTVAVDTGLLRFDPQVCSLLSELAGVRRCDAAASGGKHWRIDEGILKRTQDGRPVIDLYEHMTSALVGELMREAATPAALKELAEAFEAIPFWCSLVEGQFIHIGTTKLFRRLFTGETPVRELVAAQQQLGSCTPAGVRSAGVVLDSVLADGSEVGPGAMVIECCLQAPVRAARGAILHGLADLPGRAEAPEDCVLHQLPIRLPDGRRGTVIRVYGVADDPKQSLTDETSTWLGFPIMQRIDALGLDPQIVWEGVPPESRSLWNAKLFPVTTVDEAWACAQWLLGYASEFCQPRWEQLYRLSLASSAQWADAEVLAETQSRRRQKNWERTALSLARSAADVRPLLAHAPGIAPLAATGRALGMAAAELADRAPTQAASHYFQAGLFLAQAGLVDEAERVRERAFIAVRDAVEAGTYRNELQAGKRRWDCSAVTVSAPARIDFGGGWSDTPPFCLDWGGTVLNLAVALNNKYPIRTRLRKLGEPIIRCVSQETNETAEYRTMEELLAPPVSGDPFSISRVALQLAGLTRQKESLFEKLQAYGGGLEIATEVDLPIGSGLGTSSIAAATVLRALARMLGVSLSPPALIDLVLLLEQRMTTGGGWQDQVGGIFPGAKLIVSGPGLRQRVRVEPLQWSQERQAQFCDRFLLYYTGIRRLAKDLLRQVVGSYLAREGSSVQVLHSIKTLATEMAYAMCGGEWDYLGQLIDRHWELNQVLDPHTTCPAINALLREIRPYVAGAKLAGAGGGGFLMLLARSPEAARQLRQVLCDANSLPRGRIYEFDIAAEGLRTEVVV